MNASAAEKYTVETSSILNSREQRGREIAKRGGIRQIGARYRVPSQSSASERYLVDLIDETCTCPDYELRRQSCKHVHAVYYFVAWGSEVATDGSVTETVTVKRKTYSRDWSAYNSAQTNEGLYIERLLSALCDGIEEPARTSSRGRR